MKRVLCVAAALALAGPAVVAQPADLRLLVWINGDKGYNGLQKVGDAFERASGVKVTVQHPEAAPDKFQAAAGAGKGPDIFCWPHDRVGEWAKSGPDRAGASGHAACETRSRTRPGRAFTWNNRVWGYPLVDRGHRPDLQQGAGEDAADHLRRR